MADPAAADTIRQAQHLLRTGHPMSSADVADAIADLLDVSLTYTALNNTGTYAAVVKGVRLAEAVLAEWALRALADLPRAADLPEGSIVATDVNAWIRHPGPPSAFTAWLRTGDAGPVTNSRIDAALSSDRATVLRHGYGEDQQ